MAQSLSDIIDESLVRKYVYDDGDEGIIYPGLLEFALAKPDGDMSKLYALLHTTSNSVTSDVVSALATTVKRTVHKVNRFGCWLNLSHAEQGRLEYLQRLVSESIQASKEVDDPSIGVSHRVATLDRFMGRMGVVGCDAVTFIKDSYIFDVEFAKHLIMTRDRALKGAELQSLVAEDRLVPPDKRTLLYITAFKLWGLQQFARWRHVEGEHGTDLYTALLRWLRLCVENNLMLRPITPLNAMHIAHQNVSLFEEYMAKK